MKVAIYSRFSTDTQDVTSIAGQVANCEALASREGLTVVARYRDEGISGNDDNRPGYKEMLTGLESGKFVGIVCDETSRLTRNQSELHRLVAELNFRDQFLISGDGIDTRSESSELLLSIKAAVDAMEGRKIGYRTYRSLRERHKAGHCAGGRIYGYSTEQDGDYRTRVKDPEQAAIVKEIFERYAAGESAKKIARALNERGVPSPGCYWNIKRANGWPHTTLLGSRAKASGMLRNPIYKGSATWNRRVAKKKPGTGKRIHKCRPESEWICVPDESLRIVSDELWNKVQGRLRGARRATNASNFKTKPARYLLSGILKCDSCGGHYVVRNSVSYGCSSQTNGRDVFCQQRATIRRELAEGKLLAGIKSQLLDGKVTRQMAQEIQKRAKSDSTTRTSAKKQIAEIDRKIQNVVDSLEAVGQSEALSDKLMELEDRKQELAPLLALSTTSIIVPGAADKWREIVNNLENLREYAKPDEMETARGLLREIIGEVIVKEEPDGTYAYPTISAQSVYICGTGRGT